MSAKKIDTLVEDMYSLLDNGTKNPNQEALPGPKILKKGSQITKQGSQLSKPFKNDKK